MFDEMTATLGGRAAEEIIFGRVSTGALNDLERVTKQAYNMVVFYGLNDKIGNISYYDSTGQQEYTFNKPFSEKTAEVIDQEIAKLVEKAYQRAVEILKTNKDKLEQLAGMLLEKEVIFGEDLETIFGKKIKHIGHEIVLTEIKANGIVEEPKKPEKKKLDS
jgi:ATP-dependent Zn protease